MNLWSKNMTSPHKVGGALLCNFYVIQFLQKYTDEAAEPQGPHFWTPWTLAIGRVRFKFHLTNSH